jgi:steroid delta-isomerase-like uncharacterized protein
MSVQQTQQTMDAYLEALLHGGDFAQYFADDVLWVTTETGDEIRGRDAVCDFITAFHTKLFDASPEVRNLVVVDGAAFLEADFVGTHTGEFAGVPPTGKKVRLPYAIAYDLSGGKITGLRAYIPLTAMIAQLRGAGG